MISVIVPVYKAEKYLNRCVDSILAQSYTDFELLLINDGSPDNSGVICDEYAAKDSRVRVFHKENGGVSSARNLGLDNADGDYIAFCDADDSVDDNWLSAFVESFEDGADFIAQGYYRIVENNFVGAVCPPTIKSSNLREVVMALVESSTFGFSPLKAFRRKIIEKNNLRFDVRSSFTEDAQFIIAYMECASLFCLVSEAHYYYYIPNEDKKYVGDNYYSILRVCDSFKKVFGGKIPKEFSERYFSYVKNGAVEYLLQGKELEEFHLSLYKDMVNSLDLNRGIKDKIRNVLIVKSPYFKVLSRCGLTLMKKISE